MAEAKFVVHKTTNVKDPDDTHFTVAIEKANKYGEQQLTKEATPLADDEIEMSDSGEEHFELYEEEFHTRPPMTSILTKLANYKAGIEPTSAETKKLKEKSSNKLGTILGVYFPCIQNIFGVLYFVRLVWIIGCTGCAQGFLIVLICCCTTFLTLISMSAIATNGKVPAGGSYFMISRSLGPEFGGTVGILFYFGTTVASAMYIIGAVEVLLQYIAPSASLFGPVDTNPTALFNNTRVYGTALLCILMICVLIGIRFVSKFATLSLACVIVSFICVYIGLFVAHPAGSINVCMLGDRLLAYDKVLDPINNTIQCNKFENGPLYKLYCGNTSYPIEDESCNYFNNNDVKLVPAFPGLTQSPIGEGFLKSYYTKSRSVYGEPDTTIPKDRGQEPNMADVYISFTILMAIFFPSVTGIMAGSNRSGDLANPGFSIPLGSLVAWATTSFVYLSSVILFAATINHHVMRDKFGISVGGGLIVAKLAWPNHWVILIGSFLSTVGAALQCLTGAPRLLQAIAQDNVIPILEPFKVTTKRGEPVRAQALTFTIAFLGILIASIDYIAPLITMFFLMCYAFVNLATALNGILKEPNWRPRFKYYHWIGSIIGLILCVALMFISSWYYALVAVALACGVYKYIEYRGAAKEWGDATQGFRLSAAKKAILQLGDKSIHTKNWRPQILVLVKLRDPDHQITHPKLLDFCSQLKAGRGLTVVGSVIEGEIMDRKSDIIVAKEFINRNIKEKKLQGMSEVIAAPNVVEGLKVLCQAVGLGNLRHNCVIISFPEKWMNDPSGNTWKQFMATIRCCQAKELAVIVPKGIDKYPSRIKRMSKTSSLNVKNISSNSNNDDSKVNDDSKNVEKDDSNDDQVNNKTTESKPTTSDTSAKESSNKESLTGTVDLWCIVHDGGLLMLLAHLLIRARAWNKCSLRVFVVASESDNTINLKKEIKQFVYDLRISAEVEVVELDQADISAYVFQRTMDLAARRNLLQNMNMRSGDSKREFQCLLDKHHCLDSQGAITCSKDELKSSSPDFSSSPPFSRLPLNTNAQTPFISVTDVPMIQVAHDDKMTLPEENCGSELKSSNTEQTLVLNATPDATPQLQNQRSVTFASSDLKLLGSNMKEEDGNKKENQQLTNERINEFTFSPSALQGMKNKKSSRRMHNAVRLNEMIRDKSKTASLVILNLPGPSKNEASDYNYMEYVETLTYGLERTLLVRGTGKEVITAYAE